VALHIREPSPRLLKYQALNPGSHAATVEDQFEEANQIIIRSAQAARASALLAVRRLYGPNPDEERTRLTEWCQHSAEPSVQDFVNAHDQHHDQLDDFIENAKKSR
jgi:hypothetical protein